MTLWSMAPAGDPHTTPHHHAASPQRSWVKCHLGKKGGDVLGIQGGKGAVATIGGQTTNPEGLAGPYDQKASKAVPRASRVLLTLCV